MKASKRTRQRTQEGAERPEKRTRWEPSPVRPSIPFAVTLAAARAAAAISRAPQPSSTPSIHSATPAARPSWPPTPTRPMDREERDYYTYFATNYDSLAPKLHEHAPGAAAATAGA